MTVSLWRIFVCIALASTLVVTAACTTDPPTEVQPKGDEGGGGDDYCAPPCSPDGTPPAPWDTLTWEFDEVDVGNPTLPAGIQSKMIRKPNGDIHIAYFKLLESEAECDIAVFAGGTAPNPTYQLRVATLLSGAADWTMDIVDLAQVGPPDHATARYGVDATLDGSDIVTSVAAGGPGLAQCGSTDVVTCRGGVGSWNCTAQVTDSGACCPERDTCVLPGLQCCDAMQNACRTGSDVGSWSAIARADNGTLGIAYTDVHNFWDEDGQNHQGLEFTEGGGSTGIRAWSSQGKYTALIYDGNIPIVATTSFIRGGLTVLRRPAVTSTGNDWLEPESGLTEWEGFEFGERFRLEKAPNGTFGLLFHAAKDRNNIAINDLVYCTSADGGVNWSFPCKKLVTSHIGAFPSLAYDNDSIPYIAYRYCGNSECPASQDGLRMAWFDDTQPSGGKWWRFVVHSEASSRSGLYNQIVVDPDTKEPTVAFQHLTRGSLVVARGRFN